ncbi:MAG TPA: MGMT family protein [Polyangiaceae bacterium]
MPRTPQAEQFAEIYAVVRAIPRGRVATYGEVAELASLPRGHRIVARAMRTCPDGLPWYRVLGRKDSRRGRISIGDSDHARRQRRLLEAERVKFDESGFVSLRRFGLLHAASAEARNPRRMTRGGLKRSRKTAE